MTETTVSYDSRAIIINGKRTLLLSGAIHYPRSTPAMWPDLMQRSREAGLNTIETYVFWNLHERQQGILDFSERLNLLHFCQLAQEHGLYVILRIGPYICAETNYGGFPAWLRDVPNMQMRTWNEPFMREMERWVRLIAHYLHPMFAPNGGPIILLQLENEYNNIAHLYGEEGQRYLAWVSNLAENLNLGIPSIMCQGAAPGSLETMNSFYAHKEIAAHKTRHPDQPALWTENWPGWYDTYGTPHHTRSPQDCAYGVARFIAAGGTGVNYYMWHGGTNFERSSMYLQTTSYAFDAPLNEYGFPTTKAHHLAHFHTLLHQYAELLLAHEHPLAQPLGDEQQAYVYTQNGADLTFLCNDGTTNAEVTFAEQQFSLPAMSVSLLTHGQLIFNTADIKPEYSIHQHIEPQNLKIDLSWYAEPLPSPSNPASTITSQPVEQLRLTHDMSDYCWYTTTLNISPEQSGEGTFTLSGVADIAHIFVDGQFQATTALPLAEDRGPIDGAGFMQTFPLSLTQGAHTLSILTCALGLIKGDWMLGNQNMVEERKGFWGQARWKNTTLNGPWTIQAGLTGEQGAIFAGGEILISWQKQWQAAINQPLRWWKLTFPQPTNNNSAQQDVQLVIDFTGMNKGIAWLNGQCIGRYWLIPGTIGELVNWQLPAVQFDRRGSPTQQYYHLPKEWVKEYNTLILFEELGGNPSSIQICSVAER